LCKAGKLLCLRTIFESVAIFRLLAKRRGRVMDKIEKFFRQEKYLWPYKLCGRALYRLQRAFE
ncbi:MAG: hypothetical protein U1D31_00510, partial [Patescibacteria group bacterium]|nr:hypothetical protein [Patescibacteria group bacterium]